MAVIGTLVAESLAVGGVIEFGLTLRRLQRIRIDSPAQDQPPEWTLIDFSCDEEGVDEFTGQLAAAMRPGSWYCDLATESTVYVVFAGKVLRYERGDDQARLRAIAYAREVGVPERQLDWSS